MSTYVDSRVSPQDAVSFPAYGPIDSILSFVMFYIFVDRATPMIEDVFSTAIPGVSPSDVGLAIAMFLWFVLVVTLLDQVRHQLAALGVGSEAERQRRVRESGVPSVGRALVYIAVVVVGGLVAAWAFEPAVAAGITMIRIVGTLDVTGFDLTEFVVMIAFFISFGGAVRAFDRLVIGGFRSFLSV